MIGLTVVAVLLLLLLATGFFAVVVDVAAAAGLGTAFFTGAAAVKGAAFAVVEADDDDDDGIANVPAVCAAKTVSLNVGFRTSVFLTVGGAAGRAAGLPSISTAIFLTAGGGIIRSFRSKCTLFQSISVLLFCRCANAQLRVRLCFFPLLFLLLLLPLILFFVPFFFVRALAALALFAFTSKFFVVLAVLERVAVSFETCQLLLG